MLKLKKFGTHLVSRSSGEEARNIIKKEIAAGNKVLVDFSGVKIASQGFCDEAFGKLAEELGIEKLKQTVKFVNCPEETRAIIKYVLGSRLSPGNTAPNA